MTKNHLNKLELLAKEFDKFNDSQMVVDNDVDNSKSTYFARLVLAAQRLGFNVQTPQDVVMRLSYIDHRDALITVDCDDQKAYVETTKLWEFIYQRKQLELA